MSLRDARPLWLAALACPLFACGSKTTECTTYTNTDTGLGDCEGAETQAEAVACAANLFLASLSDDEAADARYDFDDSEAKTLWSNLPPSLVSRAGIQFGALSDTSRDAAYTVARAALSDDGYADFIGVLAADNYLDASGGAGGDLEYCSDNYSIAIFGTPSVDEDWALMIGGHHMAYLLTFLDGVASITPNHLGAEPKSAFTLDGETFAPMEAEGEALQSLFGAMDEDTLSSAYLSGQVFSDVVLGPDEYGTGSTSSVDFPSGADRQGVLASELSSSQQALLTAAMEQWVRDFQPAFADDLMAAYTSAEALDDTYVAWGGDEGAGPDIDEEGTYFRIDGPRVWIEVACQGGIVITGETHFHTIYRDKETDYGGAL